MRCLGVLVCALAACGNDSSTVDPDGGVVIDPDGDAVPDAMLTDCEEAASHSDLAWIQDKIFTPSCASSSCHGGPEPEVGLDLSAGRAHANLVDRGSSTVAGWVRVVPGSPTESYLVVSVGRAPGPPPRDGFMPIGGVEPLCVEKLEAIERWIAEGAQP